MKNKVIILAAGEGQRLRPFTKFKPGCMIPIANKPVLQYVIEALEKNGTRDIVMVVGYRRQQIFDFFGAGDSFGVNIDYVFQEQQLGTAHALKQAKEKVGDSFLVINGDSILDGDVMSDVLAADRPCIVVREQQSISNYGVVLAKRGLVQAIMEKPEQAPTNLINTGIYRLNRDVFDFVEEEPELPIALHNMAQQGYKINVCKTQGVWLDIVYPWDILRLNQMALPNTSPTVAGDIDEGVVPKGLVSVGKGSVIRSNTYILGPVAIGDGCEIGPSVCIFPNTSIGNNVSIFPFTGIRNSVIGHDVQIGPNSSIQDSIIDKGCVLRGYFVTRSGETEVKIKEERYKVVMGAMVGEGCTINEHVVVRPGVVVGNGSRVMALKVLQENIPDESLVV